MPKYCLLSGSLVLSMSEYCRHSRVFTTQMGLVMTSVRIPAWAAATICKVGPSGFCVFPPWIHVLIVL